MEKAPDSDSGDRGFDSLRCFFFAWLNLHFYGKPYFSAPRSLANKKLTIIKMMHIAVARLDAGLRFDVSQLRKKIYGKNFLKNYQICPEKPNLG